GGDNSASEGAGQTGEQVLFNGDVVGGPIDHNLGPYASLLRLDAPATGGTDTAEVTTHDDWFGWDLAVLAPNSSAKPKVTIRTTDPNASEQGLDPGQYTVSRTGSIHDPLTVSYD